MPFRTAGRTAPAATHHPFARQRLKPPKTPRRRPRKGTKKVAGEKKEAVQTTYVCADGTTDQATLKSNACRDRGGVKPEPRQKH